MPNPLTRPLLSGPKTSLMESFRAVCDIKDLGIEAYKSFVQA